MKSQPGLIARLTSEDFLEFVEEDTKAGDLRTIRLTILWILLRACPPTKPMLGKRGMNLLDST